MMLYRILLILLVAGLVGRAEPTNLQVQNEKAAVYAAREVSSLRASLQTLAPKAKISENRNGEVTNFSCEWPDVTVRLTARPNWKGLAQGSSMKSWILSLPGIETNAAAVKVMLGKVDSTVDCIGSVTTPRYDPEGKARSLILGLATKFDGYIFSESAFYDKRGERITGISNAPVRFRGQEHRLQ